MDGPFAIIPLVLVMLIPLVAIVGGITVGIVKTLSRQRLLELAQKERLAAIERGIDPERLPPLQLPFELEKKPVLTFEQRQLRRSQGLMIGGLITAGVGAGFVAMGFLGSDPEIREPGLLFLMVGLGLLLSSRIGRPSAEEVRRSAELQATNGGARR